MTLGISGGDRGREGDRARERGDVGMGGGIRLHCLEEKTGTRIGCRRSGQEAVWRGDGQGGKDRRERLKYVYGMEGVWGWKVIREREKWWKM